MDIVCKYIEVSTEVSAQREKSRKYFICTDTLVKVLKTFTAATDRIVLRKRPNALAQSFFCTDALRHDLDKAEAQNV